MANFIWFDVNDSKTYGVVKVQKGKSYHSQVRVRQRNGYIAPSEFTSDSTWNKSVVIVFYDNHYQNVKLH